MGFRPPKGVQPPQLEGKRTGRPKGSRDHAEAWADVRWAHAHAYEDGARPPTPAARLWWYLAARYPGELEEFLEDHGWL